MTYIIPSQKDKKWIQSNASEFYGNVSSTRNIDFLKEGYASLALRTKYVNRSTGSDGFKDVVSVVFDASKTTGTYYVLTSEIGADVSQDLATVTLDDSASNRPTPTANGDAVFFSGSVVVSDDGNVRARTNGTWAASAKIASLTTGNPHPLCVFENLNFLALGDGNTVKTYNTSYTLQNTLTIPAQFEVRWMRYLNNNLYIGTRDKTNSEALMFIWSGAGSTADGGGFPAYGANWLLSGCRYRSTIALVTNLGQLLAFNGGGFDVLDNFPVYYTSYEWFRNFTYDSVMVQRGMVAQGDNLLLNIDNGIVLQSPYFLENQPSGIWQYKPKTGLYHKYSISNYQSTNDFGAPQVQKASALALMVHPINVTTLPAASTGGGLLVGARTYSNLTSTVYYTLASLTSGENRGIIQTSRFFSPSITDKFKKITIKYQNVLDASDKIIVKYRTNTRNGLPTNNLSSSSETIITWTSTTVFTTTATTFANVLAGDEVTVIRGSGAGSNAQISTITENAGTYTVTLDEAINGVSANDTGGVTVNNWTYAGGSLANSTITSSDTEGYKEFQLVNLGASRWVQFKIEMRGQDVQIEELQVVSSTQKPTA